MRSKVVEGVFDLELFDKIPFFIGLEYCQYMRLILRFPNHHYQSNYCFSSDFGKVGRGGYDVILP